MRVLGLDFYGHDTQNIGSILCFVYRAGDQIGRIFAFLVTDYYG
jgi:hypothetical protein